MNKTSKKFKDPGSAITHLIAMIGAVICAFPLIGKAVHTNNSIVVFAMSVFISSMILLYGASTLYHSLDISKKVNLFFRRIDHSMIFVLIAGSYTPICLIVLKGPVGYFLFALVWAIALIGIIVKICWITCPKWFSSVLYISMGWVCVLAFTQIVNSLSPAAFGWLLAGGIIYTVGGIIYALKVPLFDAKHKNFGSHEIFHLFVMAGSACHFILMYVYIA